ncbi:gamma-glutamyltransferase family protein [Aminirod propionatiphilus]
MNFDAHSYRHPSRRNVVFASRGMVATTHPLAAQAGLEMLKKGGNAVDAALATAASLTVLEPTSNGVGGDAFALVWHKGRLAGINGSGPAPIGLDGDPFRSRGLTKLPAFGWPAVTVPGAPATWAALSGRYGRLSLGEVLAPAIAYAEEGHPVAPNVALLWERAASQFGAALEGERFRPWFETFCPDGRAPRAGESFSIPALARSLRAIAASQGRDFYEGELARRLLAFSDATGGWLTAEDLASFRPEWVEPIGVDYRGYRVWEIPPNGQGIIALMALRILEGFAFTHRDDARTAHLQIEAMKLAFADGARHVADRRFADVPVEELLSDEHAARRRALIRPDEALPPGAPLADQGGTVYLAAADGEGMMVSYIQSNFWGFGSGLVVPETGVALHNRGLGFRLDPDHPNSLKGGKRPYHTIIPGFVSRGDEPLGPFGVMGAFMQPQGHLQVLMNAIDFGHNPQEALDAPRWQWTSGRTVEVEPGFPHPLALALARKGHDLRPALESTSFGRGQIIWRMGKTLAGGTEPRADGAIAAW